MQITTYNCDKCKKEISIRDVFRVRTSMLINVPNIPDTQHFEICKECVTGMGTWVEEVG